MSIHVKLISEDIVKPSCSTPIHLRVLPLSLFDYGNSRNLSPQIYFYSPKNTTSLSTNETLERLKRCFPSTLSMFYPLAGRAKGASHIECNDEGVPYAQAKVEEPLEDVVHKVQTFELDKLLPPYGKEGYTSLMLAIQVNVFGCGGLAIGLKMSHAIGDAFSMFMFIKTWAFMANGVDPNTLQFRPYFHIWKIFPPPSLKINNLDVYHHNQNPSAIMDKPVTKWFNFSETKLNALRTKLFNHKNSSYDKGLIKYSIRSFIDAPESDIFPHNLFLSEATSRKYNFKYPSLGMVLSAFIWSRYKVSCYNEANNIPHEVYHSVNIRPRVSSPDEQFYYFGNMFVNAIAKLPITCNDESLLFNYLEQMEQSIGETINNNGAFIRDLKEGKKDLSYMMEHYERKRKGEIVSFGFSNLRNLHVYEADFGWGKPIWVTVGTQMYKNHVNFINVGPSNKDIMAYITLTKEDMIKLENDKEFVAFVSNASGCIKSKL